MRIVGKRRTSEDLAPSSPEEALGRAAILQAQAELLNPYREQDALDRLRLLALKRGQELAPG